MMTTATAAGDYPERERSAEELKLDLEEAEREMEGLREQLRSERDYVDSLIKKSKEAEARAEYFREKNVELRVTVSALVRHCPEDARRAAEEDIKAWGFRI